MLGIKNPFKNAGADGATLTSAPVVPSAPAPAVSESVRALDALTGGAFSADTASSRSSLIRQWLQTQPSDEDLQRVAKELGHKDKGAAKAVRERLDEIKRERHQLQVGADWAQKAQTLLDAPRLSMADALAWQRDAAKAGAALSKEPLSTLKLALNERIKRVEDLHNRVMIQREAAVLLAQRIELQSTKPLQDALHAQSQISADMAHWLAQMQALQQELDWGSVDLKYPPMLTSAHQQLQVVQEAFDAALTQAQAAAHDANLPLPAVAVWAESIAALRGETVQALPAKATADPAAVKQAEQELLQWVKKLESELAQGHGKASMGAAQQLRQVAKVGVEQGLVSAALQQRIQNTLAAAGELQDWQRWRADQLRQELVAKAEGLLARPEGQTLGGRKLQEQLKHLREEWKLTDQGGAPNHSLWRRFDEACNKAHEVVAAWLESVKAQSAQHIQARQQLIDEVTQWAQAQQVASAGASPEWRQHIKALHQFNERWLHAGHVSEKEFAALKTAWKQAMDAASAPLHEVQKLSIATRHAMIESAQQLSQSANPSIDEIKQLQLQWQHQAQAVPLDRRLEQKLWEQFRQPIDGIFERKTQVRQQQAAALSVLDQAVLDAAKALQLAVQSGDAGQIQTAISALHAASRSLPPSTAAVSDIRQTQSCADATADVAKPADAADTGTEVAKMAADLVVAPVAEADVNAEVAAPGSEPADATVSLDTSSPEVAEQPAQPLSDKPVEKAPPKPVVARRGDDRPQAGAHIAAPQRAGAPSGARGDRRDGRGDARQARDGHSDRRSQTAYEPRVAAPRLGDAAFRAQRDALDMAQTALKKLAMHAHGEVLVSLLSAWQQRDVQQLPALQALGKSVNAAARTDWGKAISAAPQSGASALQALLRLEMAAQVPTPAAFLDARRALQLQMLTQRHQPSPQETWAKDVAAVLASTHEPESAKRLQMVLKALLRH